VADLLVDFTSAYQRKEKYEITFPQFKYNVVMGFVKSNMKRIKLRQFLNKEEMIRYKEVKKQREMYFLGLEKFIEEETSLEEFLEN